MMEPVAWRWAWKATGSELEQRFADPDLYEWTYRDRPPSEDAAPKMDVEPLVRLSDAEARIATLEAQLETLRGWVDPSVMELENVKALKARIADLERQPHYVYIGKDGKAVKARDLEDRAEEAEALLKEARPHEPTAEMLAAAMKADQDGMPASMKTIWMVMWGAYKPARAINHKIGVKDE